MNDGSTDNSLKILEEYAAKDARIVIENKENGGAASARNRGIEIATGEYIHFLDADDWINLSLYSDFAEIYRKGKVDIFVFNSRLHYSVSEDVKPKYTFDISVWDNWSDVNSELTFSQCNNPFCCGLAVWNKLYRRDFLNIKKLRFLDYNPFEDFLFCIQAFLCAESIKVAQEAYHTYNQTNEASLTKNFNQNVFQIFNVINSIQKTIDELCIRNEMKYAFFQYKYEQLVALFNSAQWKYKEKFYAQMRETIFDGVLETLNPEICKRLKNFKLVDVMKKSNWMQFQWYLFLNFNFKNNIKFHLFKG